MNNFKTSLRSPVGRSLITGATGFIGFELAKLLDAHERPLRLMVRRPERAALLRPLRAELTSADLMAPASLRRAVEGVDTVFHLAARAVFEPYRRVRPTIVDGSVALMEAAAEAGVRSFVYASSMLVYDGQESPIDDSTPARPRVDYGAAKLEAEQRLAEIADRVGMRFAAVRLPHVYGASDLLFERLHRGMVIQAGSGHNLYSHLHVRDAARLLLGIAEQGWTGISPVADQRPTDWREFFSTVWEHYPRFFQVNVPAWLARLGTELLRPMAALRRRPSLFTPDTVVGWNLQLPIKPGVLWDELGLAPRYATIAEGIPAALDDSLAFRWRHPLSDRSPY